MVRKEGGQKGGQLEKRVVRMEDGQKGRWLKGRWFERKMV